MGILREVWRHRRAACGIAAASTFAALILAADRLSANVGAMGIPEEVVRDAGHFLVYGSLAVLAAVALRGRWLAAILITAALGAGEEWYQLYVPGRYGTLGDWMLDACGAITCVAVFLTARAAIRLHAARRVGA